MKLIHELFGTVCAFEAKLSLFEAQLSKNNFSHFSELRSMENPDGKRYTCTRIVSLLIEEFKTRFADFRREKQKIMLFTQPICLMSSVLLMKFSWSFLIFKQILI